MEPVRGDADLRAEAELSAIGELGGGVDQDDGRINCVCKDLRRVFVIRDDAVGVPGAKASDMRAGGFDPVDHRHRDHRREILRRPVLWRRRFDAGQQRAGATVSPQSAARLGEILGDQRQQVRRNARINQQRFRSPADRDPPHLAVDHHLAGDLRIGACVHIDVVEALEVAKHRHPRLLPHPGDQALAAPRNDQIDGPAEALQHHTDSGAVRGAHHADRSGGEPLGHQRARDRRMQRKAGLQTLRPAAQDRRVAGPKGQGRRVRRHIGATLIDHGDHADGRAHPCEVEAVWTDPVRDLFAHRVLDRRDGFNPHRNALEAIGVQGKAV